MDAPDFFNEVVRKQHNKPNDWVWYSLDMHGMPEDFISVHGDVPTGVISKGPRKGQPKFTGPGEKVWIRKADVDTAKLAWEKSNNCCASCSGKGVTAWKQMCWRCEGTGKPKEGAV